MIWCVDDDNTIRDIEVYTLTQTGFEAKGFSDGNSMLEALKNEKPDLIVLDIMLPGKDGVDVLKEIRSNTETCKIPVIMATAKGTEMDKIQGLDMGADDYISKPYSVAEVMARVRSVLRRTSRPEREVEHNSESIIRFNTLEVNILNKRCFIDNQEIQLTRKEFDILELLLSNRGKILSREQIMKHVWREEVIVLDRTIDVNITRMRKKLKEYGNHIITRTGYGYGFEG